MPFVGKDRSPAEIGLLVDIGRANLRRETRPLEGIGQRCLSLLRTGERHGEHVGDRHVVSVLATKRKVAE